MVTESVVDQLLFDHQNCSFLRYLPSGYKEFPKIYYKQTLEGYPYTSTVQILEWRQVRDKYPGWKLERKLQNFLSWFSSKTVLRLHFKIKFHLKFLVAPILGNLVVKFSIRLKLNFCTNRSDWSGESL